MQIVGVSAIDTPTERSGAPAVPELGSTYAMAREPAPTKDEGTEKQGDGLSSVRAVDRAIAILRSFSVDRPSMSVIDIQKRVGLSRPTVYRLLQTLTSAGMIESEGDPQRFRLAAGVMQLAHTWLSGLNIVDVARPIIEHLQDLTGETAALFLLRGDERLCVLELKSRHVLNISRGIGDTGPIVQGASGKAILAFLTDAQRQLALVGSGAKVQAAMQDVVATVRRDGFAVSRGEVFVGAVAVAAPVFDHFGKVLGSVGIFGPSARVNEGLVAIYAEHVVKAAHELSVQMGHSPGQTSEILKRAVDPAHVSAERRSNRLGTLGRRRPARA